MRSFGAVPLLDADHPGEAARTAAPMSRARTRLSATSKARRLTVVGLSLALHGAVLLCLLMTYPVLRPRGPIVSYDVIVLSEVAQPAAGTNPPQPAQSQQQPAPPVEAPAPQPTPPPAPPQQAEASQQPGQPPPPPVAAPVPPPVAAPIPPPPSIAAQRPQSPVTPAPKQHQPAARPGPHAVAAAPRPHRPEAAPLEAERPPSGLPGQPRASVPPPASTQPQMAGPDPVWLARVDQWLMAHESYPEMARQRRQQGTVVVRFEVDRSGQVLSASLAHSSGLALLDQAALSLLRGASLPPFPPNAPAGHTTVTIPIHYHLE